MLARTCGFQVQKLSPKRSSLAKGSNLVGIDFEGQARYPDIPTTFKERPAYLEPIHHFWRYCEGSRIITYPGAPSGPK